MELYRQASASTYQALAAPGKWLSHYDEFIIKNASAVSQIESALRSLTYIIPGRFRDAEIASESLHSYVQLLSLYHDSLLSKAIARLPLARKPVPSPHNRYTRFWTQKSPTYRRLALVLQMIQYTELLWEMVAKRRGEKTRWRIIVLLEGVKALCRLLLLRLTNSRPLLSPPLPEREVDPSSLEEAPEQTAEELEAVQSYERMQESMSSGTGSGDDTKWTMPRTGLTLPSLPDSQDISSYLLSKVMKADDIKPPKMLLHRVSGKGEIAEMLYIIRPVIYALAMQHWRGDRKSWRPWLMGISIEYGARQLAKNDFQERLAGGLRGLTGLEREELRKRGWALGWWLMRGGFYENITRGWVLSLIGKLKNKPILDMVGGIAEDYEFLWNQYYFATATM
ncbi:peroxisomal membrane protein pex16 [Microthyrium microscopicum]|uniref:Peroxisomal membrane protein PEX16 n=1 Tax=Microthyrium microscopicum TaxID=703497 RepID=A0A6A6UHH3_9PEZI|nr:peroxisomal membrane protein pex16 [Microthyrium microscopicum]